MKPSTAHKADRLFHGGSVEPVADADVYTVLGDTGRYVVVLSKDICHCSCPATGECSHRLAARMQQAADDLSHKNGAGVAGTTRRPAQLEVTQ